MLIHQQNLQDDKSPLYLFVDSTRDKLDKNIELIVSLTSLSRWIDSGSPDGPSPYSSTLPPTAEKSSRGPGASIDKTSTELSPARGVGSRRRTSTVDTAPATPGAHVSLQDASVAESKKR